MIDLGQYDAIRSEPQSGIPRFIYQVYAEPDTLVAEFATRREAHQCLERDFENRYIRKRTSDEYRVRYGKDFFNPAR